VVARDALGAGTAKDKGLDLIRIERHGGHFRERAIGPGEEG
jgi:hypothetical protein